MEGHCVTARTCEERERFMRFIGLLGSATSLGDVLENLPPLLAQWSGCEDVDIRLTRDDLPCWETMELSDPDVDGGLGPSLSFTGHGSFWTNNMSALQAEAGSKATAVFPCDRRGRAGCESVALVPLRCREETVGLLLFNDPLPGLFTHDLITFLESLAGKVALAVSRFQGEELRRRAEGMVRHELKTPLSGIVGLSKLLEQALPCGKTRQWAQAIRESGEGMFKLIGFNQDIFRLENGLYELNPEPCDMAHMLRRLLCGFYPTLRRRDLDMEMRFGDITLDEAHTLRAAGNPVLLESLFANLLGNALEASPQGEKITVGLRAERGTLHVEIHNQGEVPREVRQSFFQKYATSGKAEGLGLGTYYALLFARAHAGDIDFTSSEHDGTRVRVTLPILIE